jgi:hypothetical protein
MERSSGEVWFIVAAFLLEAPKRKACEISAATQVEALPEPKVLATFGDNTL